MFRACFGKQRYEDAAVEKCFSNLLAVGFQRFEIDVYWDTTRTIWSLCPVELGESTSTSESATTSTLSGPNANGTQNVAAVAKRGFHGPELVHDHNHYLQQRQVESPTESLTLPTTQTVPTGSTLKPASTTTTLDTGSTAATSTAGSGDSASPVNGAINVGPYTCTSSANFPLLVDIMASHLDTTQLNINATLKYMVLNLHAAAPASDPTGPASTLSLAQLPPYGNLIGAVLSSRVQDYLYTPHRLQEDRADLNATGSWYSVVRTDEPDSAYFEIEDAGGFTYTHDGWPSESFAEQEYGRRLFAGFGLIDPQLTNYNLSRDENTIFSSDYITSDTTISTNNDGQVESGCYFKPDIHEVSGVNNSWATTTIGSEISSQPLVFADASNITSCGVSPVLNETLANVTADQDFGPYRDYVESTIWSWGSGEPNGTSKPGATEKDLNRCAALNAVSGYWETEDCSNAHHSACRPGGQPYMWSISSEEASYSKAGVSCQDNAAFTVPRTALENTYLLHAWKQYMKANGIRDELLWLNFNDLDVKNCWVIGQDTPCPYQDNMNSTRNALVPAIAAVIVFVLTLLTIFVKCAAGRRQAKRKRKRRGDDGWDYEGVPS